MATAYAVHELFVVVVSIYLHHLRHLYRTYFARYNATNLINQ